MYRFPTASKRFALLICMVLLTVLLSGCSLGVNVDTMLTPPKLSGQQEQIYQALQDAAGSDIRLKYPTRGSYLSAFIIADIDGDTAEEAIVFYEKNNLTAPDTGLRINVLDCIDGVWASVCDRSAEGTEIEKVVISPLGDNDRMNIIVGYLTANQSEKYISVYSYTDSYLEQTLYHSYALFDVAYAGSGARNPDLVLLGAAAGMEAAYAAVYSLAEDGRYFEHKYSFRDNYTDYTQLLYGTLPDGGVALYVDAATGTANLQTEILSLEEGTLVNLLQRCGRKAEDTVRRAGLVCRDIDGDDVPEIPVQSVFLGYEDAPESEQIRQTRWLMMENDRLFTEYSSYYSTGNGYAFLLPEAWVGHASVERDPIDSELRIVAYDGAWEDTMPVLLRIYIAYDEADRNERLAAGYSLMYTKGTASYLVKAEAGQPLSLTIGKLLPCLRFFN